MQCHFYDILQSQVCASDFLEYFTSLPTEIESSALPHSLIFFLFHTDHARNKHYDSSPVECQDSEALLSATYSYYSTINLQCSHFQLKKILHYRPIFHDNAEQYLQFSKCRQVLKNLKLFRLGSALFASQSIGRQHHLFFKQLRIMPFTIYFFLY